MENLSIDSIWKKCLIGERKAQYHLYQLFSKKMYVVCLRLLIKGSQRLKSNEQGSQKFKDNYNLASYQYGAFARLGYDSMGVFVKYYFNDMFENSPNQDGLNNFTFGLTLDF